MTAQREAPRSTLELWVEHGFAVSARCAKLHAGWQAAQRRAASCHAAAIVALESYGSRKMRAVTGGVAPTPSALVRRREVRTKRKNVLQRLRKEREEQEKLKQEELEKEEREAERREQERKEVERINGERQQQEKLEREKAENELREHNQREREEVERKERERKEKEKKLAATKAIEEKNNAPLKSGFQRAIIFVHPLKEDEGLSPLQNSSEDLERVMAIWNQTCSTANVFRKDSMMRKLRVDIRKRVNLTCNQIAASVKMVARKIDALVEVIDYAQQQGGSPGEAYAQREVALRLVQEADGSVALNRTAGFAVGAVLVGVCSRIKMQDVVLGAFYRSCMYTVPGYGKRGPNESVDVFRTRIGYKDGETAESYMERMCGYVGLFAAVVQTEKAVDGRPNPFSLDLGWSWLARVANREQRAITPAVVFAFLEVAGYAMSARYRKQFAKLMAMVQKAVVLHAVPTAPKGALSRMDVMVEEFIAAGCIFKSPPEGRQLPQTDAEFL